jgi:4'-phosphopantetheinyl transferase
MPLYRKLEVGRSKIALWKIEEDLAFFQSSFANSPDIPDKNQRLQWYASRYLVSNVLGPKAIIIKDESGKPVLRNSKLHLSISHTPAFAAVMMHPSAPVGIDIEACTPKVVRIAHKFLREDEVQAIKPEEQIDKLILYWSAKEALYKLYGKGGIEFKTQLLVEPFEMRSDGQLKATIVVPNERIKNLIVNYEFFDGHVLTYVVR